MKKLWRLSVFAITAGVITAIIALFFSFSESEFAAVGFCILSGLCFLTGGITSKGLPNDNEIESKISENKYRIWEQLIILENEKMEFESYRRNTPVNEFYDQVIQIHKERIKDAEDKLNKLKEMLERAYKAFPEYRDKVIKHY
jgi:hypothetical protein